MYTQCPECRAAFRVTAGVLQQARGQVRCGSCGDAFNALDHLSESPPPPTADAPTAREAGNEARDQALMDTLNRLGGGEEVRIEDTGVEWRVIDHDDAGETGSAEALKPVESPEAEAPADDEPRYDDNTPLPEDFSDDSIESVAWEPPPRQWGDFGPEDTATDDDAQYDLELSEAAEWDDLLDEFRDSLGKIPHQAEPGPDDDEPGVSPTNETDTRSTGENEEAIPELDEATHGVIDDDRRQDHEWTFVAGEPGQAHDDETSVDVELSAEFDYEPLTPDGGYGDFGGGTAIESAFFMDTGGHGDVALNHETVDGPDDAGAAQSPDEEALTRDEDASPDEAGTDRFESLVAAEEDVEEYEFDDVSTEDLDDLEEEDTAGGDVPAWTDAVTESDDAQQDLLYFGSGSSTTGDDGAETPDEDIDFAAMTANMKIDPEVLRAMRDGDLDARDEDGSPLVETIIMEGGFIGDSLEEEEPSRGVAGDDEPPSLLDTYITSRLPGKKNVNPRALMGAGIAILSLALAVQLIHSQRENLATYDFFSWTLGPIYRFVGAPVTPNWDVKGWQFEGTRGSTAGEEERLTITSRISNRSEKALPYPIVHVSLTDRYEDIIGSRMLEPDDYLDDEIDLAEPVAAGDNFTANITIAAAAPEATGFKLNVCYREVGTRVRCAIEDFKEP